MDFMVQLDEIAEESFGRTVKGVKYYLCIVCIRSTSLSSILDCLGIEFYLI